MGVNDGSTGSVEMGQPGAHAQYGQPYPQQPAAGYPPPGYGPPPPGYGAPHPGYSVPPPGYGAPQGPQPIPGVRIVAPVLPPQPGQVITGYELIIPETGCCKCEGMNSAGLISIILLVIIGVPCLAFIPCMMPECFDKLQRPIYGYPPQAIPSGAPPQGY